MKTVYIDNTKVYKVCCPEDKRHNGITVQIVFPTKLHGDPLCLCVPTPIYYKDSYKDISMFWEYYSNLRPIKYTYKDLL